MAPPARQLALAPFPAFHGAKGGRRVKIAEMIDSGSSKYSAIMPIEIELGNSAANHYLSEVLAISPQFMDR